MPDGFQPEGIAAGRKLYLPNARFDTPPTPDTHYGVLGIHSWLINMAWELCGSAESRNVRVRR
ncbi:hypothetical protein E1285_43720 [Actinomadura sp. 7K507]|nr:hypothetical protein E1285_43720 [Actinomadura sp. 7K507]